MPRLYCPTPLASGIEIELSANAARHVQVLRLQPGHGLTLFDGRGGEYAAVVTQMGRNDVRVQVGAHAAIEREAARAVHLAVGMPANERMDWLVEKATELGAASITPLLTERSVLRLTGERAEKKQAHWQAIANAAAEQCGRNRLLQVHKVQSLAAWLLNGHSSGTVASIGCLLSLRADCVPLPTQSAPTKPVVLLSGPEGGLTHAEESAALAAGYQAANLGSRVLRAETAPLAALMALSLSTEGLSCL